MAFDGVSPGGRFRLPGGDDRTTVIGATGSGKSTCGIWLLAHQRFDVRPWLIIDFKREIIFDQIGFPPIQALHWKLPHKKARGVYLVQPIPGQEEQVEAFLWAIWRRGNIGVFVDEASLMPPASDAFRAILQQGRSKRIPVIACTQRPVNVARPLFSEASFFCCYRMADKRDYKTVEGFVPADLEQPLPRHWWRWYDVAENVLLTMKPVPPPEQVAELARTNMPAYVHPFPWLTSGRQAREGV